jgi:Asp-tRNA(Asn)/Glu-tRNA(Gln) amidotransferase A subunit family amidase
MFSAKQDHPTRREFLAGVAAVSAASAFPTALSAQNSAPSLCFTSAVDMAAMIRAKKLSAREALEAHLKQIDRVNPQVNAIVTLVADQATAAAARADEMQAHGEILGPLHGLPVAHKDLLETAGVRTTDWMKSCWYISATGNPAASVPAGFTPEGLPVGLQIVGRDKQDFSVLQLSHAFEQATNFGKRRPSIAL